MLFGNLNRWWQPVPLGERGERHAARVLRRKGFRILFAGRRNRFGEIDVIAIDERAKNRPLVFVEVKTRRDTRGGAPSEAVTAEKQRRLSRSATEFLRANDLLEHPARFDVISIVWPAEAKHPRSVEHLENAFEVCG